MRVELHIDITLIIDSYMDKLIKKIMETDYDIVQLCHV